MRELKLQHGERDGKVLHVSEVSPGFACSCLCPHCHTPLIAKKGSLKQHHFSHFKSDPCKLGLETALHLAAKQVLEAAKRIHLPKVRVNFGGYNSSLLLAEKQWYPIEEVLIERRSVDIVPDVTVIIAGRPLLIEIHVTHEIDQGKRQKIAGQNISAIEIDLSQQARDLSWSMIEGIAVGESTLKKWIFNRRVEQAKSQVLARSKPMAITTRGCAMHVDFCPVGARTFKGKPYANVMDDCIYCEHFLERNSSSEEVKCMGYSPSWRSDYRVPPLSPRE